MEKMKDQEKVYEDKRNEEEVRGKRPYRTPMVQRLGKVKDLTQSGSPTYGDDFLDYSP